MLNREGRLVFSNGWVGLGAVKSESKIHALLATARIANVPSVVSNLGVGILLGSIHDGSKFAWPWGLMVAAMLFYVSGNFLNDWWDRDWDKEKRPERALPQGMFSASTYFRVAIGGLAVGLVIAALNGWAAFLVAAILVGLIVQYTKVHKRAAWSVIPMGLCRACLPILGYAAMRGNLAGPVLFPAVGLFVYVLALSLSARWEARGDLPISEKWKARGLLLGSGVFAAILPIFIYPSLGWMGLVPFVVWLSLCISIYQSPVSAHVSALLAGIPLIDWILLLPLAKIWLTWERVESDEPMYWIAMLLAPSCFVLGRLLQRVAPAT
ncbi:MAG: UbiA family prenyltransferase [Verrucomicrobiota bacterium]